MVRKMLELNEYVLGKKLVKVSGCEVKPHFKQDTTGTWIPDESIPAITILEKDGKETAKFSVKINFTGTQRLNIFDQKEQPQKTLPVRITVFNSFGVETMKTLNAGDSVDMLLSELTYSAEYGYQAVAQWICKSENKKDMYNIEWTQTFSENSKGKNLVTFSHQKLFQKRLHDENGVLKDESGKSLIDETAPILTEKTFPKEEGDDIVFGVFAISASIHSKTVKAVLNKEQKEDYAFHMIFVSVFGNLYNRMKALNENGKLKTHFDMDMLISTNDDFNNGTLLSFSFTPKKESEPVENTNSATPNSSTSIVNAEAHPSSETNIPKLPDAPAFPDIEGVEKPKETPIFPETIPENNGNIALSQTQEKQTEAFPEWMNN